MELAPRESLDKDVVEEEIRILERQHSPENMLQLQFQLAEMLFEKEHEGDRPVFESQSERNEIMEYWVTSGYSNIFRRYVESSTYKEKYESNPFGVTLEDLESFKKSI